MTILDIIGLSNFWRTESIVKNEMDLSLVPLHEHPEHTMSCCELLNDEWKRSEGARLHSLQSSSDKLPTCLILLRKDSLVGHAKLSRIPSLSTACFVESVVIARHLRRQGYGTRLMEKTEEYCRDVLNLNAIYLSTQDKEIFYARLGYTRCAPVSIYGGASAMLAQSIKPTPVDSSGSERLQNANRSNGMRLLPPPPLPPTICASLVENRARKVFMMKKL